MKFSSVQQFTVTIASPAVFTATSHGLSAGDSVYLYTTGALPTGLSVNTQYYVISAGLTANDFQLSATPGGSAINTSGSQSGTHSMSTPNRGLIQDCEFWTGLGDFAISGNAQLLAKFTQFINNWYQKVSTMIFQSQDDWDFDDLNKTTFPIALVTDQRDYTFPTSPKILKIKRVDIAYDGTNYYRATPIDISEISFGVGNDATVDGRFSKAAPRYDLIGNGILIYPRANSADVASGATMRIETSREITEFTTTDSTKEPEFDEPFHRMLSIGASYDYAVANNKPNQVQLANYLADYEQRLKLHYGGKEADRVWMLKSQYIKYE